MITTEQRDRGYKRVRLAASAALAFGIVLLPLMAAQPARAQTTPYTILYTFTGGSDGGYPRAPLIADKAGNLYGTTVQGGLSNNCLQGGSCGVVFKLDTNGNETVLYTFTGGADGSNPRGGVVRDESGNLYGTTANGGLDNNCYEGPTCGVVFKLDPNGNETVLYSFTGGADGGNPYAGVIRDAAGNLYGTTFVGGAYGGGTVFKIDSAGVFSVLHTFTGGADGGNPAAGVIRDTEGNLYGTTLNGGGVLGVVFKLDPAGNETVLHTFTGNPDGAQPQAGVFRDAAGNLYGTTTWGGATANGTVFKIDAAGNETVLRSFMYTRKGGAWPQAGVVRDASGNLYGTTLFSSAYKGGGDGGAGTLFRVNPAGQETVVHSFTGADGVAPEAALLLYKGILYGTAGGGGPYGQGVVFKVGR
jgi:uncharacterized repeat protein (TIGR03803 family)